MSYQYEIDGKTVMTKQPMDDYDRFLCLTGTDGLKPYLRMMEQGMPNGKVEQVAWLLLQGGGCGFCKVCRDEPCGIKEKESCTANIANYLRNCVHEEDAEKA